MAIVTTAVTLLSRQDTPRDVDHPALVKVQASVVLSTQGGATNNIPASVFGLVRLTGSTCAGTSDNSAVYPAAPSADGSLLLIGGGSSNAPQDVSKTVIVTVEGFAS